MPIQIRLFVYHFNVKIRLMNSIGCDKITLFRFNLINKFKELTNCPIIINTSFNVRGEPIVNTPEDAFRCFMGTNLDNLAIGNFYLNKKNQNQNQNQNLKNNYQNQFELD